MKHHPTSSDWVSLLYGELDADQANALREHRDRCEPCAKQFRQMEEAHRALSSWTIAPAVAHAVPASARGSRWGLAVGAAAALLCLGLWIGWQAKSSSNPSGSISKQQLQQELLALESRLNAQFAERLEQARTEDEMMFDIALRDLEARQAERIVSVRREVQNMAAHARAGLLAAEEQLTHLVNLFPSDRDPEPQP